MKYITGKYSCWLLAVSCWLQAACTSEQFEEHQADSTLNVAPYAASYQGTDFMTRSVSVGYEAYNPDHDLSIGLYVWPTGEPTAELKLIRYNNSIWHSQATVQDGNNYSLFGYMPKRDPITSAISKLNNGDIQLVLSNMEAVMTDDVCMVTGVKDASGDLLQGSFLYAGQSDNNFVRLLMDHLFAAVRFRFTMGAGYSALRTIRLKSMTLTSTAASVTATITLRANTTGADPVVGVTYTQTAGSSSATFFDSAAGEVISDDAVSNYLCCYAPIVGSALTLVSTYDVYDKQGNIIRENCTSTNKLPNLSAERGQCVTLNMTILPTYLYQLSDPDLDNPTVRIIN